MLTWARQEVAGGVSVVPFMLKLLIRLSDGREIENDGTVFDVCPVDLAMVELLVDTVGTVPVEKGRFELAFGMVLEESGAVPVDRAIVPLPRDENVEPEVGADENEEDGR